MFNSLKDIMKNESEIRREDHTRKNKLLCEHRDAYLKLNKYKDYTEMLIEKLYNNTITDRDVINTEIAKMKRLNDKLNSYERNMYLLFNEEFYYVKETDAYNRDLRIRKDENYIKDINKNVKHVIYKLNEALKPKTTVMDDFNDDDYNI